MGGSTKTPRVYSTQKKTAAATATGWCNQHRCLLLLRPAVARTTSTTSSAHPHSSQRSCRRCHCKTTHFLSLVHAASLCYRSQQQPLGHSFHQCSRRRRRIMSCQAPDSAIPPAIPGHADVRGLGLRCYRVRLATAASWTGFLSDCHGFCFELSWEISVLSSALFCFWIWASLFLTLSLFVLLELLQPVDRHVTQTLVGYTLS